MILSVDVTKWHVDWIEGCAGFAFWGALLLGRFCLLRRFAVGAA